MSKVFIRFERGALDVEPVEFTGEYFQITYDEVRDEHDDCIAWFDTSMEVWRTNDQRIFSDLIIGAAT